MPITTYLPPTTKRKQTNVLFNLCFSLLLLFFMWRHLPINQSKVYTCTVPLLRNMLLFPWWLNGRNVLASKTTMPLSDFWIKKVSDTITMNINPIPCQMDIHGKIREVLAETLKGERSPAQRPLTESDFLHALQQRGIIDDVMKNINMDQVSQHFSHNCLWILSFFFSITVSHLKVNIWRKKIGCVK